MQQLSYLTYYLIFWPCGVKCDNLVFVKGVASLNLLMIFFSDNFSSVLDSPLFSLA